MQRWDAVHLITRAAEANLTDGRPYIALARLFRHMKLCYSAAVESVSSNREGVQQTDAADEASVCASYMPHRVWDAFLILERMLAAGEMRQRGNHETIFALRSPPNVPRMRFGSRFKNVIILDDFLDNANQIREFALRNDFSVKGNYPGLRNTGVFSSPYIRRQLARANCWRAGHLLARELQRSDTDRVSWERVVGAL